MAADPGFQPPILQPGHGLLGRALPDPGREKEAEPGRAGDIGVPVTKDVQAFAPGGFYAGQGGLGLVPVGAARGFEVGDLQGNARLPGRGDGFVQGLEQLLALVPHVGGIDALVPGRRPAQLDELPGLGEGAGSVFQAARKAERPGGHGPLDQKRHPLELLGLWWTVVEAHDRPPNHPLADESRIVDGRPRLLQPGQKSGGIAPGQVQAMDFLEVGLILLADRIADGKGGASAVPADERRDPLPDRALGLGIDQKLDIGVGMDIDEPGTDHQPLGVDEAQAASGRDRPDDRHPSRLDPQVRGQSLGPGPVDEGPVLDDQVQVLVRGAAAEDQASA